MGGIRVSASPIFVPPKFVEGGRLHPQCNRLRLLATCSITITNEQNHNVIDYDYTESNHNYNRDYIGPETPSKRK